MQCTCALRSIRVAEQATKWSEGLQLFTVRNSGSQCRMLGAEGVNNDPPRTGKRSGGMLSAEMREETGAGQSASGPMSRVGLRRERLDGVDEAHEARRDEAFAR